MPSTDELQIQIDELKKLVEGKVDSVLTPQKEMESLIRQHKHRGIDTSQIIHAHLKGTSEDDHDQYILVDGTRAFTGAQSMGSNKLTSVTDPTANQDAATKKYIDDHFPDAIAGKSIASSVLLYFDGDTGETNSSSYVKVADVKIPVGGPLRIAFGLRVDPNGNTASVRIYRNDVAVGTERTNTTDSFVEYEEEISGWTKGDNCQLYAKLSGGTKTEIHNFKISVKALFATIVKELA